MRCEAPLSDTSMAGVTTGPRGALVHSSLQIKLDGACVLAEARDVAAASGVIATQQ
jgi:predicted ATP-grasp superfamily ATP-dependent carboligase